MCCRRTFLGPLIEGFVHEGPPPKLGDTVVGGQPDVTHPLVHSGRIDRVVGPHGAPKTILLGSLPLAYRFSRRAVASNLLQGMHYDRSPFVQE